MSERVHELKVDPELWEAIVSGDKPFEIRKNDRHFQRGDVLRLSVFDPKLPVNRQPDIEPAWRKVTFVLMGGQYGLESGYVALGVRPIELPRPVNEVRGAPYKPPYQPPDCDRPPSCDYGFMVPEGCTFESCRHFKEEAVRE